MKPSMITLGGSHTRFQACKERMRERWKQGLLVMKGLGSVPYTYCVLRHWGGVPPVTVISVSWVCSTQLWHCSQDQAGDSMQ